MKIAIRSHYLNSVLIDLENSKHPSLRPTPAVEYECRISIFTHSCHTWRVYDVCYEYDPDDSIANADKIRQSLGAHTEAFRATAIKKISPFEIF